MLLVVHVIERISDRRQRERETLAYCCPGKTYLLTFDIVLNKVLFLNLLYFSPHSSAIHCHLTKRIIVFTEYYTPTNALIVYHILV